MNILIGDIGNTNTKISGVDFKSLRIKKIIHFNSNKANSINFLKKNLHRIINILLYYCNVFHVQNLLHTTTAT